MWSYWGVTTNLGTWLRTLRSEKSASPGLTSKFTICSWSCLIHSPSLASSMESTLPCTEESRLSSANSSRLKRSTASKKYLSMVCFVICSGQIHWVTILLILKSLWTMKKESVPTFLGRNQPRSFWTKTTSWAFWEAIKFRLKAIKCTDGMDLLVSPTW